MNSNKLFFKCPPKGILGHRLICVIKYLRNFPCVVEYFLFFFWCMYRYFQFIFIHRVRLIFRPEVCRYGRKSGFGYSSPKLSSRVTGEARRPRPHRGTCSTTTRRCSSPPYAQTNHAVLRRTVVSIIANFLSINSTYESKQPLLSYPFNFRLFSPRVVLCASYFV